MSSNVASDEVVEFTVDHRRPLDKCMDALHARGVFAFFGIDEKAYEPFFPMNETTENLKAKLVDVPLGTSHENP